MQPPNHTPLIALPAYILDLETTGLDVKNDRVLQIGALAMQGDTLLESPVFDQLVNPGIPIPASSTAIHHITDEHVSESPAFKQVTNQICDIIKGNVIIGHHIAFDIAILRQEFARYNLLWHEPVNLDISMLVGALHPSLPDVSLESVATLLGVSIHDRHTAMGDSLATARCWAKLIPLLQEKNIRTLGEAISLANQRQDLILRQVESGWMDMPAGLVNTKVTASQRIDCYVFEHRLSDVMSSPAQIVSPETTLRQAARAMIKHKHGCLLIGVPGNIPQGILTERDIMRLTAEGELDMDSAAVRKVMSSPVECIHQNEMLYRGLARMDRLYISHLCVVDDFYMPVGVVSQRNLLQYRARGPNMLSDAMEVADDASTLASAYARVTGVAAQLVADGLSGTDAAQVISTELQTLTRRASQLAMRRMQKEGHGDAPADWCVLVLGSGGRGESLLSADQDNALIHTGTDSDDAWFEQFGIYLTEILDTAGLPYCKGKVMVSNPDWRGTESDWYKRVSHWIQRASPDDLLSVDIFFDLIPVAGNHTLAHRLHRGAIDLASKSRAFINLLAQSVQSVTPQFGLFGRPVLTDGRIALKRNGLLPLVSFARTLAIRSGSLARSTPQRLQDVIEADRLPEGDAVRLIELHRTLLTLILKQQLRDSEEGIPLCSKVDIKQLSGNEYKHLQNELHHLDTMVGEIQSFIAS